MEQLIQFRSVIESFDNDEFDLFTEKLFHIYDKRTLLIKSLFFMLLNESKHNNYNDIRQINKICKLITDLRRKKLKSKTKQIEQTDNDRKLKPNYFNTLSSPIISQIASYLKTAEQTQFMPSNRYIFISCSSTPSTIQSLKCRTWLREYIKNHGQQFEQYQISKLSKFRMAKQITLHPINKISPQYFGENGDLWKWNNLQYLNVGQLPFVSRYSDDILKCCDYLVNILKQTDIKHLKLGDIYFTSIKQQQFKVQKEAVLNILTSNENIQCLQVGHIDLFGTHSLDSFDCDAIKQRLKHLKGFGLDSGSPLADELLSRFSKQLESLHIGHCSRDQLPLSSNNDIHYKNVKELCMITMGYDIIYNVLRTANNLKRIHWGFGEDITPFEMNAECQQMVLKLIWTQLTELEYLGIMTSFNSMIFECIEQAFNEYIIKRKNIKLRIKFTAVLNENELEYIEENIEEIIGMIDKSVMNDFVFSLNITVNNKDQFKGIGNRLKEMESMYSIQIITDRVNNKNENDMKEYKWIHITNKNNTMCGYNEKWMFKCDQCCF